MNRHEKYLKRVQERRDIVVKVIEKTCDDVNESLPALFTVEFSTLSPQQILILDMSIDIFWQGYEYGREY